MPKYRFQCTCGVSFEKNVPMTMATKPSPCPACSKPASREIPKGMNATWDVKVTGPVPQNTGIHGLDTNPDRVIGQDSTQRWGVIRERVQDKKDILRRNPDVSPDDLARDPVDNTYRIMSKEERAIKKPLGTRAREQLDRARTSSTPS